jgi:hypothetical protein
MKNLHGILRFIVLTGVMSQALGTARAADDCAPLRLDFAQPTVAWAHLPLSKLKRDTVYTQVDSDGKKTLHAVADSSASLYVTRFKTPLAPPPSLSWQWKTAALVAGADNRDKKREDASLRLIVAFDGDVGTLPDEEQKRFKRAKRLSGRESPFATLMYIWSEQVPVNTVIPSAHTSQLKMLVVASGSDGLGTWQSVSRALSEDYRLAFGQSPGRVLGIAVMTDTDNTGTQASADYADIRFACTPPGNKR